MISTRLAGALAAGALALGILVGSAGTIAIRDVARPDAVDANAHMGQMATMMSMMGGGPGMVGGGPGMMGGGPGMIGGGPGMMSSGSGMMTGQDWMGPAASAMPDWMQEHHQAASPAPSR